jgi:hypothetical protein
MQLHLDDQVVKRRLIQVMEQQLLAENSPAKPSVEEIASAFSDRKGELQRPPLYSIEHVFFARDRESEASAFVATVTEQMLDIQAARRLGSPFLQGHQFTRQTPVQLTKNFGKDFVIRLEQALAESQSQMKQQQWLGPIPSAYGLHYVWLTAFEPARAAELREVEQQLRHDLEYVAKNKALQCAIAALRNNYDIRGRELKGSEQKDANVSNGEGCQ